MKKWLENFWYHNKWIVLIAAFFIIAGTIILVQYIQKDEYDALILYTGPESPDALEIRDIEDAFEDVLETDFNKDSQKSISLKTIFLLTDEQYNSKEYQFDENGNLIVYNSAELMKNKEQYTTQIFVGEAIICLLDPSWYDEAYKKDAFVPLNELIEKVPENAYNDSALYLKDTDFGKYYAEVFKALPEDTLICFRKMSTTGAFKNKRKEEKRYEFNKELFVDILEFTTE
ncbi:MAG: hypothetical protein E7591_08060 [Ruminococcaceae bacterium]|nr:hypothetical protein [Oscillospiraceae bacterium]